MHREHLTPGINDSITARLRIYHKPVRNADHYCLIWCLNFSSRAQVVCLWAPHTYICWLRSLFHLALFPLEQPAEGVCRLITEGTVTFMRPAGITKDWTRHLRKVHRANRRVLFKGFDLGNNSSTALNCQFIRRQLIKSTTLDLFPPWKVFLFCTLLPSAIWRSWLFSPGFGSLSKLMSCCGVRRENNEGKVCQSVSGNCLSRGSHLLWWGQTGGLAKRS